MEHQNCSIDRTAPRAFPPQHQFPFCNVVGHAPYTVLLLLFPQSRGFAEALALFPSERVGISSCRGADFG